MTIDAPRTSGSPAETREIGLALGALLRGGDVVLLDGELGAGKTTLVRAVAEGLGLGTSAVASPTFVMIHEYTHPRGQAGPDHPELIHVDAYRLSRADELDSLGWDEVMARAGGAAPAAALVIEWAERLGPSFRPAREPARVRIEHAGEQRREFLFALPDSWRSRPGLEAVLARRATTCPITGERVEPDCPTYPFANERARLADLH